MNNNITDVNINDVESIRRNEIALERGGYLYNTTKGTVGITAPYTSIVGNTPYTANWSFPYGINQLWDAGRKTAIKGAPAT
jgi:hypothetical protein